MTIQQAPIRVSPVSAMPMTVAPTVKEIPYDYVAKFTLPGEKPGNRVQQVINISTEGAFVAVAIGYSFIPKSDEMGPDHGGETVNLLGLTASTIDSRVLVRCLLARLCGIDFKYSIIDSGSGRELQNMAIHNIAGLGRADGDRPFRQLSKPQLFMPRSTIRIEVEEISVGPLYKGAELYLVFHGYKILGYGTTP